MKKDIQEAFERALAGFEKRQEAEHQHVREREKFETEWTEEDGRCGSSARRDQRAIEQGGVAVPGSRR